MFEIIIEYRLPRQIEERNCTFDDLQRVINDLALDTIKSLRIEASLEVNECYSEHILDFLDLRSLARCTSLERLELVGLNIYTLFQNLIGNRSVKELMFSHCHFEKRELKMMILYLGQRECVLQSLKFQSSLYSDGLNYLAYGLCFNASVKVLDLDEIYMKDEVVIRLAQIVHQNRSISHLKLPAFRMRQEVTPSVHPFAGFLCGSSTLTYLTLREDPLDVPSSTAYNIELMGYLCTSRLRQVFTEEEGLNIPLIRARNELNAILQSKGAV